MKAKTWRVRACIWLLRLDCYELAGRIIDAGRVAVVSAAALAVLAWALGRLTP